jgi:hypothetical protein
MFLCIKFRNSEEIVKVTRIEIYACMASRWFRIRGAANNAKLYKQERLYCRTAV